MKMFKCSGSNSYKPRIFTNILILIILFFLFSCTTAKYTAMYTCVDWQDLNRDNYIDKNEIIGKNKDSFKLNEGRIHIYNLYTDQNIKFEIRDLANYKVLIEDNAYLKKDLIKHYNIGILGLPKGAYEARVVFTENNIVESINFWMLETPDLTNIQNNILLNKITKSTPTGLFFYVEWKDQNGNDKYELHEFVGLNKNSYNPNSETVRVGLNVPSQSGSIVFQSFDENGAMLGTTIDDYQRVEGWWIGPGVQTSIPLDFIDRVKLNGTGIYQIVAIFENGETLSKELTILIP